MARPREFDKDDVLYKTMLIFWKKGYDGTSIPDILDAAGISRSSLYETFGDKQTLFLAAMDRYRQFIGRGGIHLFEDYLRNGDSSKNSVLSVLRTYFEAKIDISLDKRYPGGCFITNVATSMESADERVKSTVRAHLQKIEDSFRALLEEGKAAGEISEDSDIVALSRYLLGVASGINVLARARHERELLENIVSTALLLIR